MTFVGVDYGTPLRAPLFLWRSRVIYPFQDSPFRWSCLGKGTDLSPLFDWSDRWDPFYSCALGVSFMGNLQDFYFEDEIQQSIFEPFQEDYGRLAQVIEGGGKRRCHWELCGSKGPKAGDGCSEEDYLVLLLLDAILCYGMYRASHRY